MNRIRLIAGSLLASLLLAACQPAAPAATPAKPTEPAKPAATAASPVGVASPVTKASPVSSPASSPVAAAASSPSASPAAGDVTASVRPPATMPQPGNMPAGSYMRTIQDRGQLVAGVRQDVLFFGFLNPRANRLEGFDIDLVREIARAIFGDESKVDQKIVTSAARIPFLKENTVDIVAATMTITASRKEEIDFSEVYYNAEQRVLVKNSSTVTGIQDLGGKRVCAAKGSTSELNITRANPQAQVVQADGYTDCLLSLQQDRVDAISTDDVILASLNEQDPQTKIVGPGFASEPYGLGIAKNRTEFVGFVNGVLQQTKSSGKWKEIYTRWLGKLGTAPEPPRGTYVS